MDVVFRFLGLMKGQLLAALLGVLVSVIASLSSIGLMATSGWFITAMGVAGFTGAVLNIFIPSAMIRMFALLRTVLRYFDRLFSHDATFKIISVFRLDLFTKAIDLKTQDVAIFKSSDLERRLRSDVDKLELAYLKQFMPIVCAFIVSVIVCSWFLSYDIYIALSMLTIIFLAGILIPIIISLYVKKDVIAISEKANNLNDKASDLTFGLFDLTLMDKTQIFADKFKQEAEVLARSHARLNFAEGLNTAFLQAFTMLIVIAILLIGTPLFMQSKLAANDLIMLAITSMAMFEVITPLSAAFLNLAAVQISAKRVFDLVDNKAKEENEGLDVLKDKLTTIEFKDVDFAYQGCIKNTLSKVNLKFECNKNYIIKGRSGIGKSTIISLISAIYEPSKGQILANNIDYSNLNKDNLREHLSVATQDLSLFSGNIKNIFTAISPKISDDEIYELLKIVELDEFVKSLPDKLLQFTGNTGILLSGGQARRLCLARALCKKSDFLLLDEPSEGLDLNLEQRIINRILNLRKGIIMITHKDAGLELVDEIIKL